MKNLNEDIDFKSPKDILSVIIVLFTFCLLASSAYIYFYVLQNLKHDIEKTKLETNEATMKLEEIKKEEKGETFNFDDGLYDEFISKISENLLIKNFYTGVVRHQYVDNDSELFYPIIMESHLYVDDFNKFEKLIPLANYNLLDYRAVKNNKGWTIDFRNLYIFDSVYGFKDLNINNIEIEAEETLLENIKKNDESTENTLQELQNNYNYDNTEMLQDNETKNIEKSIFMCADVDYIGIPQLEGIHFNFAKKMAPVIDQKALLIQAYNYNEDVGDLMFMMEKHRLLVWAGRTDLVLSFCSYTSENPEVVLLIKDSENKEKTLEALVEQDEANFKLENLNFPVEILGFGFRMKPGKREYVAVSNMKIRYNEIIDKNIQNKQVSTTIANSNFEELDELLQYYNINDIKDRVIKDNSIEESKLNYYDALIIRPNKIMDYYEKK